LVVTSFGVPATSQKFLPQGHEVVCCREAANM